MNQLRDIIAKNICELRTNAGLTQQKLAEILNYSDKAISKWERGESVPDVTVLKQLADHFSVTVDYLLTEEHTAPPPSPRKARTRFIISLLSILLVWLIATLVFAQLSFFDENDFACWLVFIYAIPVSSTVALVFNSIWGIRRMNYFIISVLTWSVILSVYLTLLMLGAVNLWELFIVGAPAEVIIIVWSALGKKPSSKKIKKTSRGDDQASSVEEETVA